MTITDLRLNTIDGITSAIERLVKNQKGAEQPPSKLMLIALDAVLTQIENAGSYDAGICKAMEKCREAYGLPKQQTKQKETSE